MTAKTLGLLTEADRIRSESDLNFSDEIIEAIYAEAGKIANESIVLDGDDSRDWSGFFDDIVTSPITGIPIMIIGLATIFYITIWGANYPSQMIATGLFYIEGVMAGLFESLGAPWWLTGFIWHGVYRGLAWVIAVMLPPMAIFFPMFTLLEDLGYLPRVAFNLDPLFRKVGAHGKQALTMSMGFGCNAAGIISTRIIDSPRERLIAIITNNFVPCNGRFPTLIMISIIFVAAEFPPGLTAVIASLSVVAIVMIGVIVTLGVSFVLSKTVLKGEASTFALELPPYRRPKILRVLYTSLIDRTMIVLWRAIIWAAPAGAVIWLLGNISLDGSTLTSISANFLDPLGRVIGLDGVVMLTYIIAIPANEIVIPTMIMAYMNESAMLELGSLEELRQLLVVDHGWTLITGINLMLFSLLHSPCSTTIYTIWKETGNVKWTALATFIPLFLAFLVTFAVYQLSVIFGFVG